MASPILATKLYIPPPPPRVVVRPRLIERLNGGLRRKLTLVSAPAGFGKTTLVSEWVTSSGCPAAWLSLDEADSDPSRFLTYLVSAVRTVSPDVGGGALAVLQSPQPPSTESVLTALLNEIAAIPDNFILVLDDYHVIDSHAVDQALAFLLDHLPLQMHLAIATREDPQLPLPRLRARDQLTELRAADLRFTAEEAAGFLNRAMGLDLSAEDVAALEARTEGWIAGLQLAAISLQGHHSPADFIESFTGSHHFVLDYLVEEVLQRQSESVHTFLLRTSVLDRLCGPLCDAVVLDGAAGQETLEYLERANLFIVPLDDERRWYRYHHLFADLLRQRLQQQALKDGGGDSLAELHRRASQWFEDNGLVVEAFQHAVAADDFERTARIVQGRGIPLHFKGVVTAILNWLESLPKEKLNSRPSLWALYASMLLVNGQSTGVEEKLRIAEAAVEGAEPDDQTRNYIGQIATARATLALSRYDSETMLVQSRRALEYLGLHMLSSRANAYWTLGYAYLFRGERVPAREALTESVALSSASGSIFTSILAVLGLATLQEMDNHLYTAADTYRRILHMAGDQPLQIVGEVHMGLARILYEWNDLDAAEQHGRQGLQLSRQYDTVIDRFIVGEMFLARLKLARGDVAGAAAILAQASRTAREKNFVYRIPEVAAAQVVVLLRQGNVDAASELAGAYPIPLAQARAHLARGDTGAALAVLAQLRADMEAKGWEDERLKAMVLQALAFRAHGETDQALRVLGDALVLAEPGGFVRIFVDEGAPMAQLLAEAHARGTMPEYVVKLLAAFEAEGLAHASETQPRQLPPSQPLVEPLSERELEVLRLIAQGLSNREISERLFLALDTVKGHNRKVFDKLHVQRRTEAVARARDLGLL